MLVMIRFSEINMILKGLNKVTDLILLEVRSKIIIIIAAYMTNHYFGITR